jgi:DNA-binding transcriptional MerR regulator
MKGAQHAPGGGELRLKLTAHWKLYPNVMVEFSPDKEWRSLMTAKTSSTTMHIGELAERTGLSLRTIRHYDEVGLLPATARTDGGFRVYSEDDFDRLTVIKQMKPLGFSLEEMADILTILRDVQGQGSAAGNSEKLSEYLEKAAHQRAKMARNLVQADEFIKRISGY